MVKMLVSKSQKNLFFPILAQILLDKIYIAQILYLLAVLGPGVYSASNRNEYQKQKNYISGE
jgi:hypothetical protein